MNGLGVYAGPTPRPGATTVLLLQQDHEGCRADVAVTTRPDFSTVTGTLEPFDRTGTVWSQCVVWRTSPVRPRLND